MTYTVNRKAWIAGLPETYVLALVAIEEQGDVYLPCNIVGCDPALRPKCRTMENGHEPRAGRA